MNITIGMNQTQRMEYCASLKPGDHISCIYRTKEELFSLMIPFFAAGLKQHNKCVYVLDDDTQEEIRTALAGAGIDLAPYLSGGQFVFVPKEEVYLKNGTFSARYVTDALLDMESQTLREGYKALRVTGGTSWLQEHTETIPELMNYEANINHAIENRAIIALCQYPEYKFDARLLIDVLRTHPTVYLYDRILTNKFFSPSDHFIPFESTHKDADVYHKMLQTMEIVDKHHA